MIGIVTGVQGMRWYEVTVTGQDAHTGATPMHLRKNALLGAARMIEAVHAHRAWTTQPAGRRHGRAHRDQAQLAQRRAGRGVLHGRLPPSRRGRARRDGGGVPSGAAAGDASALGARLRGKADLALAGGDASTPT